MSNLNDHYFRQGQRHASKYDEAQLAEMLKSDDYYDIYEALGAIGKRKLKSFLEQLKNIALYDEDLALQDEAIRTIRRIGGRKALDILRFLKRTEHKELIEAVIMHGAEVWR